VHHCDAMNRHDACEMRLLLHVHAAHTGCSTACVFQLTPSACLQLLSCIVTNATVHWVAVLHETTYSTAHVLSQLLLLAPAYLAATDASAFSPMVSKGTTTSTAPACTISSTNASADRHHNMAQPHTCLYIEVSVSHMLRGGEDSAYS
jgi:hypothetical protein